jgi:hypothetical protein
MFRRGNLKLEILNLKTLTDPCNCIHISDLFQPGTINTIGIFAGYVQFVTISPPAENNRMGSMAIYTIE